jgi:hypothetical protein
MYYQKYIYTTNSDSKLHNHPFSTLVELLTILYSFSIPHIFVTFFFHNWITCWFKKQCCKIYNFNSPTVAQLCCSVTKKYLPSLYLPWHFPSTWLIELWEAHSARKRKTEIYKKKNASCILRKKAPRSFSTLCPSVDFSH